MDQQIREDPKCHRECFADGKTMTESKEETTARLIEHAKTLFNLVDTADMLKIQEYLPEREINASLR